MGRHKGVPASFALFMRLFMICLAATISIGTKGPAEPMEEQQSRQADSQQEVS